MMELDLIWDLKGKDFFSLFEFIFLNIFDSFLRMINKYINFNNIL